MNLSEEDEKELHTILSRFLWERIRNQADKVWKEKGYDDSTIEKWLNEENRTEANAAIRKVKADKQTGNITPHPNSNDWPA